MSFENHCSDIMRTCEVVTGVMDIVGVRNGNVIWWGCGMVVVMVGVRNENVIWWACELVMGPLHGNGDGSALLRSDF